MPRACPVECSRFKLVAGGNVKHHGASPWPLANRWISLFCSCEHEIPQGKPVVSATQFTIYALPTFLGALYHGLAVDKLQARV